MPDELEYVPRVRLVLEFTLIVELTPLVSYRLEHGMLERVIVRQRDMEMNSLIIFEFN